MVALPTKDELLSLISTTNNGFISNDYPYVYAHRFIASYPEVIPTSVRNQVNQDMLISTPSRSAASTLAVWADSIGSTREDLALVLADTWVERHFRGKASSL